MYILSTLGQSWQVRLVQLDPLKRQLCGCTVSAQVAYHPFSPASPAAARPRCRSNCKRRDGQPACCANCGCESTCLWRRDRFNATRILCNACGIYKATNFVDRPLSGKFPARRHGKRTVSVCQFHELPAAGLLVGLIILLVSE
jgi:hypothetical protein